MIHRYRILGRLRTALSIALALTLGISTAGAVLLGGAGHAGAVVVKPFTLGYDQQIYGDFLEVGNGNLRCPTAADGVLFLSGTSAAACAAGQQAGGPPTGNNNYFMMQADVDSDPGTFNSSRAALTIPPGASVDFARLNWGGDTGKFKLPNGSYSAVPSCTATGQQQPPTGAPSILPPGNPTTQQPRLTVGTAASVDVPPSAVTVDPDTAVLPNSEQFYSGYADVTSQFTGAATGSPLSVTVGNVWSPEGFNCFAGWSLVLVYKYLQRTPTYAPSKREVFIYDGHVRQGASDAPTTTTVTGFRAAGNQARVGVTAYEGDRQISGDQFLINGTAVPEPSGNGTTNFFVSHTDGATDPNVYYNFSVGAKSFSTALIPTGSTSATLTFTTSGDGYLAQNLALSLPVPELVVTKAVSPTVAHAGDPVTYSITVTNPSGTEALGVSADDPLVPACDRQIGTLAGGQTVSYTCSASAPAADQTNVITAAGKSDLGDPISGTAIATLQVIHPAITIAKTADKAGYRPGDTVTFTLTATNTGDTALANAAVSDPSTPACARPLGTLAPGASVAYTCTTTAPVPGGQNTATVAGTDQLGKTVTATATAPAPVIHPAIAITKTASPATVRAGETVTYTITVTNTGDSPLSPVSVADPLTPACARTLPGTLAAGASQSYTCTAAPSASLTNTATVTGTDLSGQPVTASASAPVTVINPALALTKTASPATARPGDTVTYTMTLTNIGDVPLTNLAVDDPSTPSCARPFDTLLAGAAQTWTCTAVAGSTDFTNSASASGTDPTGRPVTATANAPVHVIHPKIDISKTASPGTVRQGDTVTYTITVTNTGDVPLSAVTVADPSTPACAATIGSLGVGAVRSYTCTTTAGASDFSNTATAAGAPPLGAPVTATASAMVHVIHPAVSITKTASPALVRPGQTVTYSITVINTGDVPLTNVTVADASAPACAQTFATLEVSGIRAYTCTVTAGAASFTNTAAVTAAPPVGPAVTDTATASVTVIHPALTVTKVASPATAHPGDPVSFTVTVTNSGDTTLVDVAVSDPLYPGCDAMIGTLAAGASAPVTCTATAPASSTTNTAVATGTPPDGVPVSATGGATVTVIHPAVTISKTVEQARVRPGDTVAFDITVTNTGDVPLNPVTVTDPVAADCARSMPGPLAPGASVSYRCTMTAGDVDYTNTATVTGTDPTGQDVTGTASAAVDVIHPAITIAKSVSPSDAQPGQAITYTITVTNSGDVALTDIAVTDPLVTACERSGLALQPAQQQSWSCPFIAPSAGFTNTATATGTPPVGAPVTDTGSAQLVVDHPHLSVTKTADVSTVRPGDPITFTITVLNDGDVPLDTVVIDPSFAVCARTLGSLSVGQSISYQCTVAAPLDSLDNTAVATGTPPSGPPVTATGQVPVTVIHPGISITKTGPAAPVRQGDTVTFTLTVENTGDVDLTAVTVTDPTAPDCAATIGTLPPRAPQTYTCTVTAPADDFTNTATAVGTDPTAQPVTDQGSATVDVIHPSLTMTKVVAPTTARPGDPIAYTFTVTNTGDTTLTGVQVSDPALPSCGKTLGTLTAGQSTHYACDAVAPADDLTNTATATGTSPVGPPVSATASATLDVVHPSIAITKTTLAPTVHPGDTVSFDITVTNTGDVTLTAVTVSDPLAPGCARTLGTLAAGDAVSYTCTMTALGTDYANTADVIGQPAVGGPVTAQSSSPVAVIHPALTLTKTGPGTPVRAGQPVTFTITVTNAGDVPLTAVTVTDPTAAGCTRSIGDLAVGAKAAYTCTRTAPDTSFTNTAHVDGTDPLGGHADASGAADVTVVHPAITLTKTADVTHTRAGGTITFTITARNTGDVLLSDITISDPSAPRCGKTIRSLAVGAVSFYTCTVTAPSTGYTNTANAVGTPVSGNRPVPGGPVTATARASVHIDTTSPPAPPTTPVSPAAVSLPSTGAPVLPLIGDGLLLVALGLLLTLAGRRRAGRRSPEST